nr:DUF4041 domain-containing protein [uncultured Noviherbaspirillum sp.]
MQDSFIYGIAIVTAFSTLVLGILFYQTQGALKSAQSRLGEIVDLDAEKSTIKSEITKLISASKEQQHDLETRYAAGLAVYTNMQSEIALLSESLEDISFGMYEPHFSFQSSPEFRMEIENVRREQKELIRGDAAAICNTEWRVAGSRADGVKLAKQNVKLVLRAFNGECDAAVANVSWNNATKMEMRIRKSFEALNKLGVMLHVHLTEAFLDLKLKELRLTFEYAEKRQAEKEEERRIREQLREEERAQRDYEKAQGEAEAEERLYGQALERAKTEVEKASGVKEATLAARISELEEKLRLAHEKKERAIAMAQLTKSGYVYVISNQGAFGEGVYKIGMTRRLDPMDRVIELGDASVPFPFDVHAMLYSDNAPELERALHDKFAKQRVNLANYRKEFFAASLTEIEEIVREKGFQVEFAYTVESRQYRESLAERSRFGKAETEPTLLQTFPKTLFGDDSHVLMSEASS